MIGVLVKNEKGEIETSVSAYNPSEEIKNLTADIAGEFQIASNLQNEPFEEFNDKSLLERMNIDQRRWNAYQLPQSEDIDEEWRWNGVRPITRNKIMGIVAQMTSRIVMPAPFAQNDKDEMDRASSEVMGILMEYNIRNSNYVEDYINWITEALVNPKAFLSAGFFEQMQTIRENDGSVREVVDELMSGFQTNTIPCDEILLTDFYGRDLQKHKSIFRRRYIDYSEVESRWGEHENFEYIKPGIVNTFSGETNLFYDAYDEDRETTAEEITYYNRLEDTEITFVNGIYLGNKNTEANPIKHRSYDGRPKYPFAELGYEPINSRFFYDMSAAWKLGSDDELVTRMEQLTIDGTFLSVMPPTITAGVGQMNEAIVIPGKNTAFENENVSVQPIQLGNALQAGWNAILKKENDISESTFDPIMAGVSSGRTKTASESMLLAENAKIQLGRFGNMLANSLQKLGGLIVDIIINHQTVGEVEELLSGDTITKYRNFVVSDEDTEKRIIFNDNLIGREMNPEEQLARSREIMKREGGVNSKTRIYEVNPEKWRKMKFYIHIGVDELLPLNVKEAQRASMELLEQQKVAKQTA